MKKKTKILIILCMILVGIFSIPLMVNMGNKRWGASKTDHDWETDGFRQGLKSGDNYVLAINDSGTLKIYTHTSADDIVAEGVLEFSDADLQMNNVPCAMQKVGSRIHIAYINDDTSPKIKYGFSDDDGENWTFDEAVGGEDGYALIGDNAEVLDVLFVDSTPFCTLYLTIGGSYRIFDLTDFSSKIFEINVNAGIGYISDDEYFFPIQDAASLVINKWDGTTNVQVEVIDGIVVITVEAWNTILLKKGTTFYYFGRYSTATNNVYYVKKGINGGWNAVDMGEKLIMHLTWEEDRAEPRFIHWAGTIDELYYMNDAGYLLKIARDVTETTKSGIGDFLFPYEIVDVNFDIFNVVLRHKHLGPRKIKFGYNGTDLQENDGFVVVEDDGTVIILAIESLDKPITGVKQQNITAVEPSFRDLRATIQEDFEAADEADILAVLFEKYFGFMFAGTIDDTGDTRDTSYKIRVGAGVLTDVEAWNARRYYWEAFGAANFDEGDEVALLITRDYKTGIVGVVKWDGSTDFDASPWSNTINSVTVVDEDGHNDVIYAIATGTQDLIYDTGSGAAAQNFEFWAKPEDLTESVAFSAWSNTSGGTVCTMRFHNDGNIDFFGSTNDFDIMPYTSRWFHVRIEAVQNDNCKLYINGDLVSTITGLDRTIDELRITSASADANFWFDSFGFENNGYSIPFLNYKVVLTDANSQVLDVFKRGQDVNDVIVKGGVLEMEPRVAFGRATVPGVNNQSLVTVIHHYPSLRTDAECITRAQELLASGVSSLKVYSIEKYDKFIPQVGQTIDVSNTLHSLTNAILIVNSWRYDKDNKIIRVMAATGLIVKRFGRGNVVDANTERIDQNSRLIGELQALGTIYYLDSAASDIGGYKKMLLTYTGAAEENISVASAVDDEAIEEFATDATEPGTTVLIAGLYTVHIHASKTGGVQNIAIYFELWKRAEPGGAEVLLATSHSTDIFTGADNILDTHLHIEDTVILATDRLVIKFKARVTGFGNPPSFDMHIQGDSTSRFRLSFTL